MSAFESTTQLLNQISVNIRSNGGVVNDNIDFVQTTNEGVGIYANKTIAAGETLISVPYSMCITPDAIVQNPLLQQIFSDNAGIVDYPDEVLAIGLMHAKLFPSEQCSWSKHVLMLPADFNTTIFWSDEELEEMKGNMVYHLTKMMLRQIETDYDSIHAALAEAYPELLGGATKELYKWALSVVYSRSLEITRQGKNTRCIVPVLDMANHNPHSNAAPTDTFRYEDEGDRISLLAPTNLQVGEECYAVYGIYPNSKLLYSYGFVVLNNPHRAIDLWVRLQPTSVGYQAKQTFLHSNSLTREQTYDFKGTIRPNYVSPALLATIRVIQAEVSELPLLSRAVQGRMLTLRNEAATYVSLRNLIIARMDVERAEADATQLGKMLLDDVDFSNRLRCALIVRVEERKLLEEVLVMVNRWISELESQGAAYLPPDAPKEVAAPTATAATINTTAAQP